MKALKFLFIFLMTLNLAACAFDKNTSVDDKRESEDNAFLNDKFDHIRGLYVGTVTAKREFGEPVVKEINLTIYPVQVPNGRNSRGDVVYKPELRARYLQANSANTDLILGVKYFDTEIPASLSISNFSGSAIDPQSISLTLQVYGDTLTGTASTGGGVLGPAEFKLKDRNATGPSPDDQVAENARREQLFKPVLGTYEGEIIPVDSKHGSITGATVTLYIDKVKEASSGRFFSILRARYHPLYDPSSEGSDLFMDVDFSPDNNPPAITLSATGWVQDKAGAVPNYVLDGIIENGVIEATFTGNGQYGKAKLTRPTSKTDPAPGNPVPAPSPSPTPKHKHRH
jgi:hypothetical protein